MRLIGPPSNAKTDDGQQRSLLDRFNENNALLVSRAIAEVHQQLDAARSSMATNPAGTKRDLTTLREFVLHAAELPANTRAELRESIEAVIQQADTRLRISERESADGQQAQAAVAENRRVQNELAHNGQKEKQLIERMRGLLDERRFAEAEDQAAAVALREAPESATAHAAMAEARLIGNIAMNQEVRDSQQKQYLAAMHLVDVSAIPFPDEPPIVYPPAEQWSELTKARVKYRGVDMERAGQRGGQDSASAR